MFDVLKTKEEKDDMSKKSVNLSVFIDQIKDALTDSAFDVEAGISWFVHEFLESMDSKYMLEEYPELKDFKDEKGIEVLDQDGGGEGEGEHCHIVFQWGGVIYKLDYAYYSYHGTEFHSDEFYVVEPKTKTITVYE